MIYIKVPGSTSFFYHFEWCPMELVQIVSLPASVCSGRGMDMFQNGFSSMEENNGLNQNSTTAKSCQTYFQHSKTQNDALINKLQKIGRIFYIECSSQLLYKRKFHCPIIIIKGQVMQAKKATVGNGKLSEGSANSMADTQYQLQTSSTPQSRGRELQAHNLSIPSLKSAPSRSASRGRKNSKNKLFEKAHLAAAGETYLKDTKNQYSSQNGQNANKLKTPKTPTEKNAVLTLRKELDLKINGVSSDQQSSFSRLVMELGCQERVIDTDLSSIREDGYQTGSDISYSQSFLKGISANS